MKHLIIAISTCLLLISANVAWGQRTGWDGTWVGGWDRDAGVQIIFAGETLIGFYFRNDYKVSPAQQPRPMAVEPSCGTRAKRP